MILESTYMADETSDVAVLDFGDFRREAFAELDLVYTVARLIGGTSGELDNALPAIMLMAYRTWSERPAELRPRAWMLSLLINHLKADDSELLKSHGDDTVSSKSPGDSPDGTPSTLLVRRAIREMCFEDREVLALCDIAQLRYDEAGIVLGLSRSEIKDRLYGARERLHARINVA